MKKATLVAGALLVCAVSGYAIQLRDVLQQMQAKFKNVKEKIHTIKMIAETEAYLGDSKILTENTIYQKGDKIRSETRPLTDVANIPKEYLKTVSVYDGKDMWIISKAGVQKIPVERKDVEQMKLLSSPDWISAFMDSFSLKGEKQVEGKDCYVLEMQEPYKMTLYIDKDLLDWIKMEQISPQGEKITIVRKDFITFTKDGDSIKLPRRIEMYVGKDLAAVTTIKDVELNVDLSDTLFTVETKNANLPSQGLSPKEDKNKKTIEDNWSALEKLGK